MKSNLLLNWTVTNATKEAVDNMTIFLLLLSVATLLPAPNLIKVELMQKPLRFATQLKRAPISIAVKKTKAVTPIKSLNSEIIARPFKITSTVSRYFSRINTIHRN